MSAPSPMVVRHLDYVERLEPRDRADVTTVVIHCTELPDLATARTYGERLYHVNSQTGNSGHFYVDRDGHTEEWVPTERVAHHVRGHNAKTIGIELVNSGRYPDWFGSQSQSMTDPYPAEQIASLTTLLGHLADSHAKLRLICGHEDLDQDLVPSSDVPGQQVRRKLDPGPMFPWPDVLANCPLVRP